VSLSNRSRGNLDALLNGMPGGLQFS